MAKRVMECPGLFVQCPVVDAAHISENKKYFFGRSNLCRTEDKKKGKARQGIPTKPEKALSSFDV